MVKGVAVQPAGCDLGISRSSALPLFVLGSPIGSWLQQARAFLAGWLAGLDRDALAFDEWLDLSIGRDFRSWIDRAAAIRSPDVPDLAGGLDQRACWVLETLAARMPNARFLVFVEHPASALAALLARDDGADIEHAVALWVSASQRILRFAHSRPERVVLLDVSEADAGAEGLADFVRREIGLEPDAWNGPVEPDPLALTVATAIVASDSQLERLYRELQASCRPLGVRSVEQQWLSFERGAAVQHFRALRTAASRADSLGGALALSEARGRRLESEVAILRGERELLQIRTVDLQGELESLLEGQAVLEASPKLGDGDSAESASVARSHIRGELLRERDALILKCEDLTNRLASTEGALVASEQARREAAGEAAARCDSLTRRHDAMARRAASVERDLTALRSSEQLLRERLTAARARVREQVSVAEKLRAEVDRGVIEASRTQRELLAQLQLAPPVYSWLSVGRVSVAEECGSDDVKRLVFELTGVGTPHAGLIDSRISLIDRRGSAALAISARPNAPALVSAWHPTGRDGDRETMCFEPADAQSRSRMLELGRSDWLTVCGLGLLVLRELSRPRRPAFAGWNAVAGTFVRQLMDLPARLRYDLIQVAQANAAGPAPGGVRVSLVGALWGNESVEPLDILWHPAEGTVAWLLPASDITPLGAWPRDGSGRPMREFLLPIGESLAARRKSEVWRGLGADDQDLLLGLLDALKAAARSAPPCGWSREELVVMAEALRADAQRQLRSIRLKGLARRALGQAD